MLTRYSHPRVDQLWSTAATYRQWLRIEQVVLRVQRAMGIVPLDQTELLAQWLDAFQIQDDHVSLIETHEQKTKHDVAAFLEFVRAAAPPNTGQWIHFGLTSSDLVDTAQAIRFKVVYPMLADLSRQLYGALDEWQANDLPVMGWTHGQPAEPTSTKVRAAHWRANLRVAGSSTMLGISAMQTAKLSGPVGTFAHNPPGMEAEVALMLGLYPQGAGSSQILPRSSLALWASSAAAWVAACAKIATDLRLMNLMDEVHWPKTDGQVGSSAMAHKNNPILAEQICGMARVAQGYALMLQDVDLWLERDISNSCVERIAVPDLMNVLHHVLSQTTKLLTSVEVRPFFTEHNLGNRSNEAWVHKHTLESIQDGMGLDEARDYAIHYNMESYDVNEDARWFTRRYPE